MNYYLVDFENVNSQGLNGINRLESSDRIIIFYSENADSMTFDLHEQINQSKAYISFQKVDVGTKNALDFQLATYLGYLICEHEKEGVEANYFVVTKDRGYSSLITYWTKRNVDITLVGSLIQSMRIQMERRREQEKLASVDAGSEASSPASGQAAEQPEERERAAEVSAPQPMESEASGEETSGLEEGAPETISENEPEPVSENVQKPQSESPKAEDAASSASGAEEPEDTEPTPPEGEEEPEEKPKRTRSRRKTKTEPTVDRELRIRVEQAVPDKDVVDLVVSYIKKYKTKLGINNALAKEFKDSKKASEIYKSIKPLIADKKGQ